MQQAINMIGKAPEWAKLAMAGVALYVAWKIYDAASHPAETGAAIGAGAVGAAVGVAKGAGGAVVGAFKGAGEAINGGINSVGEAVTGEKGWTLGGAIYDMLHKDKEPEPVRTPQYVPQAGVIQQRNALESFADRAGGGF